MHLVTNIKKEKKRAYHSLGFTVPADPRVKMKECEKIDKYLDLARELNLPSRLGL